MKVKGYRITVGSEQYNWGFQENKVVDIFANHTWVGVMLFEDIVTTTTFKFREKIEYLINACESEGVLR